ncbi:MAG: YXWGXW repeat-containing protein [Planctomycetia bacterium]|nr:YXWGXW repeat-containing protein [Planctomycetia bacterium]
MTLKKIIQWSLLPIGAALLSVATMQPVIIAQGAADNSNNGTMENGQQVLTRGPIHEAFGQPTVFNPKPGLLIPQKPPQPVEELPPDEKPEGENVAWLGGYWSWDEEKNDFMWISGFWRVLPPGRQWMPGYWNEKAGQHQWVSGYWANAEIDDEEIIDEAPPESLERGAPPTAPSEDHIWVPGTYVYRDTRYLWRPGYWIASQPGWCWVPATYCWTPSGYIFVDGYWDWSIRRRGILFAPCYFDRAVVYRPGYIYRPAVCLDIDVITPHFFCRPAYGHYYFGDYYATSYLSVGITPWFNFTVARGPRFYSGDFAYYEAHYRRTNPRWGVEVRLGYERYRDNVNLRPARTFVSQQTVINNITINNNNTKIVNNNVNVNQMALAKPMKTYTANLAKNPDAPMKIEKINDVRARDFGKTAAEVRKVGMERVKIERGGVAGDGTAPGKTGNTGQTATKIRTVNIPKSPIVSKIPTNRGTDDGDKTPGKNPVAGSLGGQPSNLPPAIPGNSVSRINRNPNTAGKSMERFGNANAGTNRDKEGASNTGSASSKTGAGKTGDNRLPPMKNDPGNTAGKTRDNDENSNSKTGAGKTGETRLPPMKNDPTKAGTGATGGPGSKTLPPLKQNTPPKTLGNSSGTEAAGSRSRTEPPRGSSAGSKESGSSRSSGSSSSKSKEKEKKE